MSKRKIYIVVFGLVLFLVFCSVVFLVIGPDAIVKKIGINNVYLLVLVSGLLGGVSSLTTAPFFAVLVTAAAGGANPFILAIIGGMTIAVGDSIFYYLGWKGKHVLSGKPAVWMEKVKNWVSDKPKWLPQTTCFVYTSITPFPNDVLMVAMALSQVAYKRIIGFVIVGNTTRMLIIASLAAAV